MICTTCKTKEVTSGNPEAYPYCESCHWTGIAEEHVRAGQLEKFRAAFPDAEFVGIEHTGGGCFWLAFRWPDDPKFYIVTNGESGLPCDSDEHALATGGWGVVCRMDETSEENEDYEGTVLSEPALLRDCEYDAYWAAYPENTLSDDEVVESIRADRAARATAGATV